MKVFINPGHCPGIDSGAINMKTGLQEADVAKKVGEKCADFLNAAGCETMVMQTDNLCNGQDDDLSQPCVCDNANAWGADLFVSIHCNAANGVARGTEVEVYRKGGEAENLAECILDQIVDNLGTIRRYINPRPGLAVLHHTDMPAVLVELDFIDTDEGADILANRGDEFAAAIARGVTDYIVAKSGATNQAATPPMRPTLGSEHFSASELMCHGAWQGHCNCGQDTAIKVSTLLLQKLEELRASVGEPLALSCAYRCPEHNAAVGGVSNSQHVLGTAADVCCPDGMSVSEFYQHVRSIGFDGVGVYYDDQFIHVDIRDGGQSPNEYYWEG